MLLHRASVRPDAIVMADPGSERRGTIHYRDEILPGWLSRVGFPPVTVITRVEEGKHRTRAWRLETLLEECMRTRTIPSVAYGMKKCSAKYKGDTQRWWAARQPWIKDAWNERRVSTVAEDGTTGRRVVRVLGQRVIKIVGYDIDETRRAEKARAAVATDHAAWERERFDFWYPLIDAKFGRDECEDLIASEGLPVPPKSACTFCPNNTIDEWEELRREEPDAFAEAVALSRNAIPTITDPDTVGLMRCNPHGKRQLHVWAEGGYPTEASRQLELFMPCDSECGT